MHDYTVVATDQKDYGKLIFHKVHARDEKSAEEIVKQHFRQAGIGCTIVRVKEETSE